MSTLRYRDYDRPTHPLADFFSKQLPLMLQQHQQNKEARIHEKDMAQFRLDGQKELAQLNDELAQKREMKTFELEDAQLRLSNAEQALKDSDKQLQDLYGITPSMGKIGKDETTNAAGEIVNNLAEQAGRNRNFIIEDYSNSENYLESVLGNLDEIAQQQTINDEMMAGANFGARVANLITDANKDNKLNADDIDAYFKSKDALTKELTPLQQIGFDKTFPTAQETFFTQLEQQSLIDQRNENIAVSKASRENKMAENKAIKHDHRYWAGQHEKGLKVLNVKNDEEFLTAYNVVDPSNKEDMKLLEENPSYISTIDNKLAEGLYATLNYLESGKGGFPGDWTSTYDPIDTALNAYRAATDHKGRKEAMYTLALDMLGNNESYEDFHSGTKRVSGDAKYTLPVYNLMKHFMTNYAKEIHADMMRDAGEDPQNLFTP